MVVGGYSAGRTVEVIDLSGHGLSCANPAAYPHVYGFVGAYFDRYPRVCGGRMISGGYTDKCYRYNLQVILCINLLLGVLTCMQV